MAAATAANLVKPTKDPFRQLPYSAGSVDLAQHIDLEHSIYTEIKSQNNGNLYNLISRDVSKNETAVTSLTVQIGNSTTSDPIKQLLGDDEALGKTRVELVLGLGLHRFEHKGTVLWALHQEIGLPVGTGYGVDVMLHIVLFCECGASRSIATPTAARAAIREYCEFLFAQDQKTADDTVNIYSYNVQCGFWNRDAVRHARPVDSVVLPSTVKDFILREFGDFHSVSTVKWYFDHGIPYRRSFLFYGPPGSGKTSFLQALAAKFRRNLCFVQPCQPQMTDAALKRCIEQLPTRSLAVFEDIDALFDGSSRTSLNDKCPLTFSGLLNALDGVTTPEGHVFVLTTNHPERLDPALVRPGRVDVRVEFPSPTREQIEGMFVRFYPGMDELAKQFAEDVLKVWQGPAHSSTHSKHTESLKSMAALQQHFIFCRTKTAQEAVDCVEESLKALMGPALEKAAKEEEKEEKEEKEKEKEKEGPAAAAAVEENGGKAASKTGAKENGVHTNGTVEATD